MSDDRDYYAELKFGLERIFGEDFSTYSLEGKQDYEQVYTMHSWGSVSVVPSHRVYNLVVHVNINAKTFIMGTHKNWINALDIGCYSPTQVQHTVGSDRLGQVLQANYMISDLKDFLDKLKEESWKRFNDVFTEQLESKLSPEDT